MWNPSRWRRSCPPSSHLHQPHHQCPRHHHRSRQRSRLHRHVAIRLHRHGLAISINSSSGEDAVNIGATECPHDVAIFFHLSYGEDDECTGTYSSFYTNHLHRAEVVPVTATPRGLHRQARIVVIFKQRNYMETYKSTLTSTSTPFPNIV